MKTYPLRIGELNALVVSDGGMPVTKEFFFANTPDHITHQFPAEFDAPLNFICISIDHKNILIDTGFGSECKDAGLLIQALNKHGISRYDIDEVILTHGHLDHIGGAVIKDKPAFPNATYYLHVEEWEMWAADKSSKEHSILSMLEDSITLIHKDMELYPGIRLFHTPGHTYGHLSVMVYSENQRLFIVSDLLNDPAALRHLSSHIGLEKSPEKGRQTRKAVLDFAEEQGILLFVCHYPFPGLGYIEKKDGVHQWTPLLT
ncbi:MBL fold metallo-hydrolase [Halobacillus salinarum]|uniref:MBL fold metallo-hydrolase n=1 Tax=Halobacillus salinarum TaxID=2932257 RepID=A0ABY4EIJ0_9BACI|nr:MBL fold metallo-hydrolase [Halobacillus salinarum]UOQ44304.1 MBL fold metallo-hydrolase [Halobacillus salinarum]